MCRLFNAIEVKLARSDSRSKGTMNAPHRAHTKKAEKMRESTPTRHLTITISALMSGLLYVIASSTGLASGDVPAGRQIYVQLCAQCHGIDGTGGGFSTLSPKPADLTAPSVQTKLDPSLYRRIHEGRDDTPMGSWKHALSDDQIYDLIAYIRTFGAGGTHSPMP